MDRTIDTAMIAVQGPRALETLQPLFDQPLGPVPYYHLTMGRLQGGLNAVISRTGYTGEDGFEVIVAARRRGRCVERTPGNRESPMVSRRAVWVPATPFASRPRCRFMVTSFRSRSTRTRPAWAGPSSSTRAISPARRASTACKAAPGLARVGLKLEAKRIARQGAVVFSGEEQVGEVTSGTFSPTLQVSLAMALVDPAAAADRHAA